MQASTKIVQREAIAASGDPVAILIFTGDIASTSKDAIMSAYQEISTSIHKVLLDFAAVDYINSSGIAIIIQLLLEANKGGQRKVGISGLTPHFVKVFTMVGVAKYAVISGDQSAALATL